MDDKISIILPIFNVGDHLRGGIDSLINQTIGNENLEIIMVNDCSTDGSDKIIDEYAEKYDLRPGMGLAAPQVGVNERFFVVCHEEEPGKFKDYVLINPKLISNSEELIYASEGEGCLSVNRDVVGIVPRYARVTFTGYDVDGNPIRYRAREELSIAFQHELDHLNGILFVDKIDPNNPFKDKDFMREI